MEQQGGVLHRNTVMQVLLAALDAADPYRAVLNALGEIDPETWDSYGHIYVLGAGKAGAPMARATEEVLGERITRGLVVVKGRHTDTGGPPLSRVRLAEAAHPVPDERGVSGTLEALNIARSAGSGDLVLCLISGGGSALFAAPAEGLCLKDIQATTELLLRAGATINELNAVRKHLSSVSGGQLAQIAAPARTISLVLSDVIGSPLSVIASGPTAPDPTTFGDALAILRHYGLAGKVPPGVTGRLRAGEAGELPETPKPYSPEYALVENRIIASNVTAVEAAARRAAELGLDATIMSTYLEGEAREVGTVMAALAREMVTHNRPSRPPACLLFGGETTVTVVGNGRGGRNTELALGAALALDGLGPGAVVASFATDGGDGASPSAGAIADGTTISRAKALGLDSHAALANNDSYSIWESLGDAIMTGPTGTNVNDIVAVFAF